MIEAADWRRLSFTADDVIAQAAARGLLTVPVSPAEDAFGRDHVSWRIFLAFSAHGR